ncbi:hypothetical protein [Bradyrhizobium sp. BR13661]|jgi:hypothetical protein|uniref:hypothetical protein n=1 Tax=Bradyrhizobium sp. BR13661 TaxID=2940622 RepID=UPI002474DCF6|nr:hypothetical protein [Bradyrhizobium sp. BR13661]MDH6259044.1 hypothetical protein [Bradyrhizobium sp. BR13661]
MISLKATHASLFADALLMVSEQAANLPVDLGFCASPACPDPETVKMQICILSCCPDRTGPKMLHMCSF